MREIQREREGGEKGRETEGGGGGYRKRKSERANQIKLWSEIQNKN